MTRLLREMFGELGAWGRFWLWLGLITLGAAAAMSLRSLPSGTSFAQTARGISRTCQSCLFWPARMATPVSLASSSAASLRRV